MFTANPDKDGIGTFGVGHLVSVVKEIGIASLATKVRFAHMVKGADGRTYPRLQVYTLAEYFAGLRPKVPLLDRQAAYKKAGRAEATGQGSLL